MRKFAWLIGWLLLVAAAASSGILTPPGEWYETLQKPALTPPNIVFPVAWSLLYVMMAVSAWWISINTRGALRVKTLLPFILQLIANALWSVLFFGAHWMLIGLIDIVVLWGLVLWVLVRFKPVSQLSFFLILPYFLWVSFAIYLNLSVIILN